MVTGLGQGADLHMAQLMPMPFTISRKVDVACIQETRWTGSGCKFYGAKGQRYKLFWMGGEEKLDGIGIFVAEKWVDSVVSVERHSKRVLNLRMVLDNGL